jgi:hypothetical protein
MDFDEVDVRRRRRPSGLELVDPVDLRRPAPMDDEVHPQRLRRRRIVAGGKDDAVGLDGAVDAAAVAPEAPARRRHPRAPPVPDQIAPLEPDVKASQDRGHLFFACVAVQTIRDLRDVQKHLRVDPILTLEALQLLGELALPGIDGGALLGGELVRRRRRGLALCHSWDGQGEGEETESEVSVHCG